MDVSGVLPGQGSSARPKPTEKTPRSSTEKNSGLGEYPGERPEWVESGTIKDVFALRLQIPIRHRFADLDKVDGKVDLERIVMGGLLILGAPGRGKTYAASAVAQELVGSRGYAAVWLDVCLLLMRLRASFKDGSKEKEPEIVEALIEAPLLILDDLGAEKASDYSMQSLYAILSQREAWFRPTIVTTNLSSEEILNAEPRIATRVMGFSKLVIRGADRRRA